MKTKTTPQKALDSLSIPKYINEDILKTMPTETSDEKIEYFNIGKWVTNEELMKEYESRGLIPCYPLDLIEVCKDTQHHDFIATVWDFYGSNLSYIAFDGWGGGRGVGVDRSGSRWSGRWWFAGLRKVSAKVSETKTSSSLKKAYESGKKEEAREMAQAIQNKPYGEMMKVLSEYLKEK